MPKVSVIIPVYNVEKYLNRSMECLKNQTLKDIEFICIDDCSTDNSLEILRQYEREDNRFKVLTLKKNSGAAAARNKGLEIAKGEYLGFVDPDDAIDLNYYEELYKKAVETDADIVKCPRKNIVNGVETIGPVQERIKKNGLYAFSYEWTTALYKISIIRDNGITFEDKIVKAQDIVFLNKIILNASKLELIDNVHYYYYRRDNSLNSEYLTANKFKSAVDALCLIFDDINNSELYKKNKQAYDYLCTSRFNALLGVLFKNVEIRSKKYWANAVVSAYNNCKCKEHILAMNVKLRCLFPFIEMNNVGMIAECVKGCNTDKEVQEKAQKLKFLKSYTFVEKVFSVKNHGIHKIITILGIKIKFKSKKLIQRQRFENVEKDLKKHRRTVSKQRTLINGMQQEIKEIEKQLKIRNKIISKQAVAIQTLSEGFEKISSEIVNIQTLNKRFDNLNREVDKIYPDIVNIQTWQRNFYREIPNEFPVRLSEIEKQTITKYVQNSKNYLEFGSGGSTFLALENSSANIYSIESDVKWLDYLRSYKIIREAEVSGRLNFYPIFIGQIKGWGWPIDDNCRESYPNYSSEIFRLINPGIIDTCLIDGRFRVACALQVAIHCPNIKYLMIHDYTFREHYHAIEEFYDIAETYDTLVLFNKKPNINIDRLKNVYEEYKYTKG